MEWMINYFENIPSTHRSIILIGGITFFWMLEGILPLYHFRYIKWKHALPNFFFTLTTVIINFSLAFFLLFTADWVSTHQFGLLNMIEIPMWLYVIFGVFFLDFIGAYIAHWTEHKIKPLWMVHLVHHSDHHVDTTTANRHHPFESVVRFAFTLLGVFILGTPIGVIMLYQSLSVLMSQLNHANIRLSEMTDRYLSYFIVSPNMHKVHHHYMLPYTDSNYGNIFSIWDRLLGTYMYLTPEKIIYGVDVFPNEKENGSLKALLKQPFQPYQKPTTGR
ncbi:MAG: sterol desaturase family protein [Flavobacteriaceae bacterium]|nr:sterol desaturase family protein [Flavobacteriaceae bacterium]